MKVLDLIALVAGYVTMVIVLILVALAAVYGVTSTVWWYMHIVCVRKNSRWSTLLYAPRKPAQARAVLISLPGLRHGVVVNLQSTKTLQRIAAEQRPTMATQYRSTRPTGQR